MQNVRNYQIYNFHRSFTKKLFFHDVEVAQINMRPSKLFDYFIVSRGKEYHAFTMAPWSSSIESDWGAYGFPLP